MNENTQIAIAEAPPHSVIRTDLHADEPEETHARVVDMPHNAIRNAEDCDLVEWSYRLHDLGFSLIPLSRSSKRPTVKWKAYQDVRADKEQLNAWFSGRDANIGIVTGSVSGIVVVDADDADAVEVVKKRCPETPLMTRTSKGMHFYYRKPSCRIGCRNSLVIDGQKHRIDIRGDGGQVVAPKSLHASGFIYEALGDWQPKTLAELPVYDPLWLTPEPTKSTVKPTRCSADCLPDAVTWYLDHGSALAEGERNTKLFTTACSLQAVGRPEKEARRLLLPVAVRSGLSVEEAVASIESAYRRERTIPVDQEVNRRVSTAGLSTQELLRLSSQGSATQWIWEGVIARGCMTLFCGSAKAGKSTFIDTLLSHMDSGDQTFVEAITRSRVLYLVEDPLFVLHERLQVDDITGIDNVTWVLKEGSYTLRKFLTYLEDLETTILRNGRYDVVIIDTLGNWIEIENECDNSKVAKMMNAIKDFFVVRHPDVALLLVHHFGKPSKDDARNATERIRGASAFLQVPDMLVMLSRFNNKDLLDRRRIVDFVGRFQPSSPEVIVELPFSKPRYEVVDLGIPYSEMGSLDGIVHLIQNNQAMTLNEVCDVMSTVTRKTVQRLLTKGVEQEAIRRIGSGRKGDPYVYSIWYEVSWIVPLGEDIELEKCLAV